MIDMQIATDHPTPLPDEDQLAGWISTALELQQLRKIGPAAEITVRITDDEEMATLNQAYRQKEGSTNILSFPFELPPGIEPDEGLASLLGDLVISAQKVEEEAKQQHKAPADHWAHLVVHGTLHLVGYDHQEETEAADMESLETSILATLGIKNPYEELH